MKTQHVESLEDLVFRDKNKLYGAYFLQMRYRRYITLSLILATFLFLSALTYPLIASYRLKGTITKDERKVEGWVMPKPPEPQPLKPLPPAPDPVKKFKFIVPAIVDSAKGSDDFATQDELTMKQPDSLSLGDEDVVPVDNPKDKTIPLPEPQEPPTWVPEMPVFAGGETELYRFLSRSLRYPDIARESNISGYIYLTFIVEKDGSISNVTLIRGIGGGCDEEAMRVVKSMPPWTPGKNNGIPVRVRFNLPVKFILE